MSDDRSARAPGTLLLKVARLLFDDSVLSHVVFPTIADLQEEVRQAGPDRRRRLLARLRGYRAFWVIVVAAPIAFWNWPMTAQNDRRTLLKVSGLTAAALAAVVLLTTAGTITAFSYVFERLPDGIFRALGGVHALAFMAGPAMLILLFALRWLRGTARFAVRTTEATLFSLLSGTFTVMTGTVVLVNAFTGIARTGGGGVNLVANAIVSSLEPLMYAGVAVAACLLAVGAFAIRVNRAREGTPRVQPPRMSAALAAALSIVVVLTIVAVDQLLRTYHRTLELLLSTLEPPPASGIRTGSITGTLTLLEHNMGLLFVVGCLLTLFLVVAGVMTSGVSRTRASHPILTWTSRAALVIVAAGALWHTTAVRASLNAYEALPVRWEGRGVHPG